MRTPLSPRALEARIEEHTIQLNGAEIEEGELTAKLEQARATAQQLDIELLPDSDDTALIVLLAAAADSGFDHVSLRQGSETLTIALARSAEPHPRIMAWTKGGVVSAYDLGSPPERSGNFGLFDLGNNAYVQRLGAALATACAGEPCSAQLELVSYWGSRQAWSTLSGWQAATSHSPELQYKVLSVVAKQVPPPELSAEAAPDPAPRKVRGGTTTVSGRVPPVVIQHVVRTGFDKFRACYEAGLTRNASLTGRVNARFVIDRDGIVRNVADAGSNLPDPQVVECVLKSFRKLIFPPPAFGNVTVVYPITLTPG